jgi:hypothetical protein
MWSWRTGAGLAALLLALAAGGLVTTRVARAEPAAPPGAEVSRPPAADSAVTTVAPPRGRSLDQERDPGGGPRPHEPLFLEPLTTTTEHVRAGLSSWITPSAPFDHREDPGGVAVGLTITWPTPRRDVAPSGPNPWHGSAAR